MNRTTEVFFQFNKNKYRGNLMNRKTNFILSCMLTGAVLLQGTPALAAGFNVALLPNEPFQKGFEKVVTVDSINKQNVDFVIFNGDTKDGKSECSDEVIGKGLVTFFNRLNVPTLYSVGDNEWTDCHRISNGEYNPLERLSFIRKIFFSKNTTQGPNPLPVERQGRLGDKYSENARLIYKDVMFVTLNVIGSNNNLVATDKQCHKKSNRTQAACDAATAEYRERNPKNIKWLRESFALAREKHSPAVVIVAHADIYFPFELSDGGYKDFLKSLDENNGFTDFFHTLTKETHNYKGQVLLIMGDSHYYKVDKPMFEENGTITPNFTRVETFGGNETSWIRMHVNVNDPAVFSFTPVILPNVKALK